MHQYRQSSLALAVLGIVLAGNAVMQRVAEILHERLSNPCKMSSYERRMQRLIDNEDVDVAAYWERFLQHALPYWDTRDATLVLDCTPYNQTFTIVFVGILVQKRLLPLAWEIMPQCEKWDEGECANRRPSLWSGWGVSACTFGDSSGRSWLDRIAIDPARRSLSLALRFTHTERCVLSPELPYFLS
jgi:hypothetical protein